MPPKQAEKKRRNKRKARTEVSSSSSSSSDSEASEQASTPKLPSKSIKDQKEPAPNSSPQNQKNKVAIDPEKSFQDFYLRQATREFANDLDQLRSAGDFNEEKSIPLLISALKQGTKCFSVEERRMVGEMVADE
ncbi:hypothetical protein AC578_716 [Pseudocercospora eumusae]|uniref:Ribosome assembly protein 3 n=1 Tax=Pseudocercospora eumusae TaxID=321146 RepID=A0A139HMV2_9PEZI|nr:hypothetical protein AC578_716 [Pseudocercospora eumusae]